MTITEVTESLSAKADRHLWGHFARHGAGNLDRIGLVSGASVYPLVWNILLGARNEGYGGNLTSMAIPQEAQVRQLLGLPDTHALAALVPLGRPTRQLTKLRRSTVEETVSHQRFDGTPLTPPTHPPSHRPRTPQQPTR